jgi:histidinol-phosphate aminotransferase
LDPEGTVPLRLNRNEYFFHHAEGVASLLAEGDACEGRRYALPGDAAHFRAALALALGVEPGPRGKGEPGVCLFHGAEDALLKIMLWRAASTSRVILPDFSWNTYAQLAQGLDLSVETFPVLTSGDAEGNLGFSYDLASLDAMLAHIDEVALVILATPNNPTGHVVPAADLLRLVARHPRHAFVLDAVYDAFPSSLATLASSCPNVTVLGSMSKFFGLPGLRLGYGVGLFPDAFHLPLGFNPYALRVAAAALEARSHYALNWTTLRAEANLLREALAPVSPGAFVVCETHASFLLVRLEFEPDDALYERLAHESGAMPKAFAHGGRRYLRWGLGPAEVCARIADYMRRLSAMSPSAMKRTS